MTFGSLYRGKRHIDVREAQPLAPLSMYEAHYASTRKNGPKPGPMRTLASMRREGIGFNVIALRLGRTASYLSKLYGEMPSHLK